MNSVKIGTYQMDTAFGLYLPEYTIPAPAPQTKFVKIIGRDGSVDLSDAIGIHYDSRNWSLDFKCFDPTVNWHTLTSSVMNAIHGKRLNFEFDDDPDYFWTGRISVSSYVSTRGTGTLKVNITSDPFKYAKLSTIVTKTASTGTDYTGSMVTFNGGLIYDLSADIEPIQDLHGYANPWPAGGGVNMLDYSTASVSDTSVSFSGGIYLAANQAYTFSYYGTSNVVIIAYEHGTSTRLFTTGYLKTYIFTPTEDAVADITYYNSTGITSAENLFQAEKGSISHDWTPYSNICPISGRTGLSVYRTGKNLVGITTSQYNANSVKTNVFSLPKGTFAISVGSSITLDGIYLHRGSTVSGPTIAYVYNSNTLTVTLTEAYSELILQLYKANGVLVSDIEYVQIEADSATTYEPYNGNTYSVDWTTQAGTVYGGTLDVVTGVLTVDRVSANLNYAKKSETANGYFWYTTTGELSIGAISGLNAELISDRLVATGNVTATTPEGKITFYANGIIRWKEQGSLSQADYRTYIASNPIQIVYELATPITYQLAPQEIEALVGTNNVWSSSGDVSVTVVTPETVTNNGLPIVPTVTASADMVLRWGNYSASVQQGTSTIPQLVLETGDNKICIIGAGNISFEWSEASL